jgi:hypothetical protein
MAPEHGNDGAKINDPQAVTRQVAYFTPKSPLFEVPISSAVYRIVFALARPP